jgi:methylase of polypeptide subunit release factors
MTPNPTKESVEQDIFAGRHLLEGAQMLQIDRLQRTEFEVFLKQEPKEVRYLGKTISVRQGVFPPRPDSIALAQSIEVPASGSVLDIGTGSGVLAMIATTHLGWSRLEQNGSVTATDVSSAAVENAKETIQKNYGDVPPERFNAVVTPSVFPPKKDVFDTILANLPFRSKEKRDFSTAPKMLAVQRSMWDLDFVAHQKLLAEGKKWLKSNGCVFLTVANYPEAARVFDLIKQNGWSYEVVGLREWNPFRGGAESGFAVAVACLRLKVALV